MITINIDGASRSNPGIGASAWVIKDAKGAVLAKEGVFFPLCTNNQAEFTALKLALLAAKHLGADEVKILSDSLLLVKQYSGEYKIKNPELKDLMSQIKRAAGAFKKIILTHIPREKNKEADLMCNITMDNKKNTSLVKPAAPAAKKETLPKGQLELFEL